MRRAAALTACASLLLLGGCDVQTPSWLGGAERVIKRAPGERVDVITGQGKLKPDERAADVTITVPEQTNLDHWRSLNDAMTTSHLGLTGITKEAHARVGDGNRFAPGTAPAPVVDDGLVVAMDGLGIVSAHEEGDISHVRWVNSDGLPEDRHDGLGGGLAIADGVVYASTGTGTLRAISLADGKTKWQLKLGAPVRGNPAVGGGLVAVLTADSQTLAYDAATGAERWAHRGMREAASYVSRTSPVISNNAVVASYSSGEVVALDATTGRLAWGDALGAGVKTRASSIFTGVACDPIVQDGVVVTISTSGEFMASALATGRPLWQAPIGGHLTPWSAGNALFVLSDTHDLAAVLKRDGSVRWAHSLAVADKRDATRDVTPALYGPILAGNAVLVLDAKGVLSTFKPEDGTPLSTYELAEGAATPPIVANGALYYLTDDGTLYQYR